MKRLIHWSAEDIIVPRWMLFAKYIGFIILGLLSAISGGLRTLNTVTFEYYTVFWSYAVIVVAIVAAFGSLRAKWECHIEKWAALLLFGLLLSWSGASMAIALNEGDFPRVTGAFAILLLSMLPGVRAFSLLRRWGVK